MSDIKTVTLCTIWEWTCDACGNNNIARGAAVATDELSAYDQEDQYMGEGEWVLVPTIVVCRYCHEKYKTDASSEEDEDV